MATAFSVESYGSLRPDPADRSLKILEHISAQLSSFSANAAFINSTAPALIHPTFEVMKEDIAINVLFFFSLTLALMTALFTILAQQWIQQYIDLPLVTGHERAQIRQIRFEALNSWWVPQIIMSLAVLLQAALFLFFDGIVILLWMTNRIVATTIISTVALFFTAFALSTIIPTFNSHCPYKSPLAWVFRIPLLWMLYPVLVLSKRLGE